MPTSVYSVNYNDSFLRSSHQLYKCHMTLTPCCRSSANSDEFVCVFLIINIILLKEIACHRVVGSSPRQVFCFSLMNNDVIHVLCGQIETSPLVMVLGSNIIKPTSQEEKGAFIVFAVDIR